MENNEEYFEYDHTGTQHLEIEYSTMTYDFDFEYEYIPTDPMELIIEEIGS